MVDTGGPGLGDVGRGGRGRVVMEGWARVVAGRGCGPGGLAVTMLGSRGGRRGAAMVELAVVLPLLLFMLVAGTDFARAYRDLVVVTDRARSAAVAATQGNGNPSTTVADADWLASIQQAAAADTSGSGVGAPTVAVAPGQLSAVPASDPYVTVTVSSPFATIITYPGIPHSFTISRSVRMRLQPTAYRMK